MPNLKFFSFIIICILIITCASCLSKKTVKTEHEWKTLFNGKNLDGWVAKFYHHKPGDNYANTFRVKDGGILVSYEDYTEFNERFGHLFYEQPFSFFRLKFEYRFTNQWMKDAPSYTYRNSGLKLVVPLVKR